MSTLSEKILKAREKHHVIGGFTFVIRRPTEMEMLDYHRSRRPADLLRHVVGWEEVKELDLIPGGDGSPAPFDAEACAEWLADRSDLFVPVVNAVVEDYQAHQSALEAAQKN
jgi:hypothetical protein